MTRLRRLVASICVASGLLGCGEKRDTLTIPTPPTPVAIALDGPPGAPLAPVYAAIAGGDFTRAGLSISIVGPATAPPLDRLAAGQADIAVASEPDLLTARDRGAQLVAIGALVRSPLSAILSVAPHPITKVTELEGRTVATPGTPLANAELDAILRRAGVPGASVRRRSAGPDPARAVLAKGVDAGLGSWNLDAVRLVHHQPRAIKIEDAGVPAYDGLVLVVRQTEARGRGPVLRTFLQALTEGLRTTLATPAAAVDALVGANPRERRALELASLKATLPVLDPAPTGSPYGFVDPRQWTTFGQWMLAQGLLTRSDDAARAVTDEFLPGQGE